MNQEREADARHGRDREAEQHFPEGYPGVRAEQRAVLPERFGDVARSWDQEVLDVEAVRDPVPARGELPDAQQDQDHHDGSDVLSRGGHPVASERLRSARSLRAVKPGEVTAAARSGARGPGISI